MHSYTVDETYEDDFANSQLVAIIGDSEEIAREVAAVASSGSSAKRLRLENKYYSCNVVVKCFPSSNELTNWINDNDASADIGALIVRYKPGSPPNLLQEVARDVHIWQSTVSLIVLDDEESISGAVRDKIQEWVVKNDFEIIVLKPSVESMEEIKECNEKYGYERIVEALNAVNWPKKTMKDTLLTGNANADRILSALDKLGPDSSDDDDLEASQRDLDAIWTTFATAPAIDFKKNMKISGAMGMAAIGDPTGDDIATQLSDRLILGGHSASNPPTQEPEIDHAEFENILQQVKEGKKDILALMNQLHPLQRYCDKLESNDERRKAAGDLILELSQHIFDEED